MCESANLGDKSSNDQAYMFVIIALEGYCGHFRIGDILKILQALVE